MTVYRLRYKAKFGYNDSRKWGRFVPFAPHDNPWFTKDGSTKAVLTVYNSLASAQRAKRQVDYYGTDMEIVAFEMNELGVVE